MKLEKLIKEANKLAENCLSVTRYIDHWQVNSYKSGVGVGIEATHAEFREAIVIFIKYIKKGGKK